MNYWRSSLFQELACSHIRRIPSQGKMVRTTSWQGQYKIENKVNILTQNFWTFFHKNFLEVWWGPGELAAPRVGRVSISFLYIYNFIYIYFKFLYLFIISVKFISNFYTHLLFHLYLFHICRREFPWSLTVNIIILATNFICIIKISMITSIQN